MTNLDSILQELKRGLEDIYGPRLKGLYLYGSQARGDAEEDSDIDVAMVLDDYESVGEEIERYGEMRASICLEHDCVISVVPITLRDWERGGSAFLMNVAREGELVA